MQPKGRWDLILLTLTPLLLAGLTVVETLSQPQRVFAIATVLFAPGYLLLAALFPHDSGFSPIERFAVGIASSVALSILTGMLLNNTAIGLSDTSLLLSYSVLTVMLGTTAIVRHRRAVSGETPRVHDLPGVAARSQGFDHKHLLPVAIFIALAIIVTTLIYPVEQTRAPTTQFYLLPRNGMWDESSTLAISRGTQTLELGIVNLEPDVHQYDVYEHIEGQSRRKIASMTLNPGEKWNAAYALPAWESDEARKIALQLHIDGNVTVPYRALYVWQRDLGS